MALTALVVGAILFVPRLLALLPVSR
jgi:hypothetical protein